MVFGPLLVGIILIALPFISNRGERSPRRRPWAIAAVLMIVVMIGTLWMEGAKSPWSPNFNAQPLSPSVVGATNGPVFVGAQLFHDKGCLNCHLIAGRRRPPRTGFNRCRRPVVEKPDDFENCQRRREHAGLCRESHTGGNGRDLWRFCNHGKFNGHDHEETQKPSRQTFPKGL